MEKNPAESRVLYVSARRSRRDQHPRPRAEEKDESRALTALAEKSNLRDLVFLTLSVSSLFRYKFDEELPRNDLKTC